MDNTPHSLLPGLLRELGGANRARRPRQLDAWVKVLHEKSNVVTVRAKPLQCRKLFKQRMQIFGTPTELRQALIRLKGEPTQTLVRAVRHVRCAGEEHCANSRAINAKVDEATCGAKQSAERSNKDGFVDAEGDEMSEGGGGDVLFTDPGTLEGEALQVWTALVDGRKAHSVETDQRQVRQRGEEQVPRVWLERTGWTNGDVCNGEAPQLGKLGNATDDVLGSC